MIRITVTLTTEWRIARSTLTLVDRCWHLIFLKLVGRLAPRIGQQLYSPKSGLSPGPRSPVCRSRSRSGTPAPGRGVPVSGSELGDVADCLAVSRDTGLSFAVGFLVYCGVGGGRRLVRSIR